MYQKKGIPRHSEELALLIANAGYNQPTPLQKVVVPLILKGKSLVVETAGTEGKTATFFLPSLIKGIGNNKGIQTLIITSSQDNLTKVSSHYKRFTKRIRRAPQMVTLGLEDSPKPEIRLLEQQPHLIIGTSSRIIDHLRRNNLNLTKVRQILVDLPGGEESGTLDRDLQFILSKIGKTPQIVLFGPNRKDALTLETDIGRHQVLTSAELSEHPKSCRAFLTENSSSRDIAVLSEIFGPQGGLIVTGDAVDTETLKKAVAPLSLNLKPLSNQTSVAPGNLLFASQYSEKADQLKAPAVIFCTPKAYPETAGESSHFLLSYTEEESKIIDQIEEKSGISMNKENMPQNEEILEAKLKEMIRYVKEDADLDQLASTRKLFRKTVPFHLRSYVAAYMLMGHRGPGAGRKGNQARRQNRPVAPTGDTKTIFVSIGKNRRVYPKDLAKLFAETLNTDVQKIGPARVLDNYSFVEIPTKLADKAIEALNETEYRGRKITVNYAKKR